MPCKEARAQAHRTFPVPGRLGKYTWSCPTKTHQSQTVKCSAMHRLSQAASVTATHTQTEQKKCAGGGGRNLPCISSLLMVREEACQGAARANCSTSKGEPRVTPVQAACNTILQQSQTRRGDETMSMVYPGAGDKLLTV